MLTRLFCHNYKIDKKSKKRRPNYNNTNNKAHHVQIVLKWLERMQSATRLAKFSARQQVVAGNELCLRMRSCPPWNRMIGSGLQKLQALLLSSSTPSEWPPYSRDLSPMDYSVRGVLEARVGFKRHHRLGSQGILAREERLSPDDPRPIAENVAKHPSASAPRKATSKPLEHDVS